MPRQAVVLREHDGDLLASGDRRPGLLELLRWPGLEEVPAGGRLGHQRRVGVGLVPTLGDRPDHDEDAGPDAGPLGVEQPADQADRLPLGRILVRFHRDRLGRGHRQLDIVTDLTGLDRPGAGQRAGGVGRREHERLAPGVVAVRQREREGSVGLDDGDARGGHEHDLGRAGIVPRAGLVAAEDDALVERRRHAVAGELRRRSGAEMATHGWHGCSSGSAVDQLMGGDG